jgi:hypothetical protein
MKKSDFVVILLGLGVLIFLFWFLFLRDSSETDKPPAPPKNTSETTKNNNQAQQPDASNSQLGDDDNKELQAFVRDFSQKYFSYDSTKASANLESVKNMITPALYAQLQQDTQNSQSPEVASIIVRNVSITSIDSGNEFSTADVSIDVTLNTKQGQSVKTTYTENIDLSKESSGWKVVSVGDDATKE